MNRLNTNLLKALQNSLFNATRSIETAAYNSTRKNLLIDGNTKVICQGFTGKQVTICYDREIHFLNRVLNVYDQNI